MHTCPGVPAVLLFLNNVFLAIEPCVITIPPDMSLATSSTIESIEHG
jgi:hypothetical protein